MKPEKELLESIWESSREHLSPESADIDLVQLDNQLSSIFTSGSSYFFIIGFDDMQLKHVSPSVRNVLGMDPEQMVLQDILDRIHPEDFEFVTHAERAAFDLIFASIPTEKRKNYKVSYCFRCKTSDGSYQLFNHQAMILAADSAGRLIKSLCVHTSIEHLTAQNNHRISLIGMSGEPSFLNLDVFQVNQPKAISGPNFSEREVEIIRLMSRGMTSRDIAEVLCIAPNTVKNHRKNILNKSGCKNAGELITRCITDGLL